MKIKKVLVAVIAITLLATSYIGNGTLVKAAFWEASDIVINEEIEDFVVIPGETSHIKLPIRAVDGIIQNPILSIDSVDSPFTTTKPKLSKVGTDIPPIIISLADTTYVEFDVKVKETAKIGKYKTTLKVTADDNMGDPYSLTMDFYIQILEEKAPAQLTISKVTYDDAVIGCDTLLNFVIKNEGEIIARNAYISLNYGVTGETGKTEIIPKYTTKNIKVGDIAPGIEQSISLPIAILTTASVGMKTLSVDFEYKDIDGIKYTETKDIYITVGKNDSAPKIEIGSTTYNGDLKAGDEFTLVTTLSDIGETRAYNVTIAIDAESIGADKFIRNYFADTIELADIMADGKLDAKIPLIVSKGNPGGVQSLKIIVSYTDKAGVPYYATTTIYPEITAADGMTPDGNPNIIISNVQQSPEIPNAGGQLNVSFEIENKSQINISELKIYTQGLTSSTFSPVDSEPYQYIEKLDAGTKKKITIPLMVSKSIPEGLNNLSIKYTYVCGNKEVDPPEIIIPILDVQNDLGGSVSKPKLIISKYTTDTEEIRAGSTFNFVFDILNTHSLVAAKNITVTISQADNIFTVTQGSNSFFIDKIAAGETVQKTIELKVKADAATNAYPIEIKIDYEYDGAEPNPTTGEIGESKTEKLNLQAIENSRPVVDYVNVYSVDGNVMVNNAATLSFEFYNMGKSPLNNVVATVEGDFTKADGNMNFIGNVLAGASSFIEFDVIPNLEGTAKGVLNITFEDSNGDEVSMTKEFETVVQGEVIFDGGMGDGSGEVFNPTVPEAKKVILPIWLFILIQVIIFCILIPVTRKVIINMYKRKLRKKEEENY